MKTSGMHLKDGSLLFDSNGVIGSIMAEMITSDFEMKENI